jgi:hypothetical protein
MRTHHHPIMPLTGSAPRVFAWALALAAVTAGLPACTEAQAAADEAELAERVAALESKEEIRAILHAFSQVVDASDPAALPGLAPVLHRDFVLDAIDFDGKKFHFEGLDGVVEGFGPIMLAADANLMPSAIDVVLDGDSARASFKFANSVKPPPQLGLDVGVKVLLFAANAATFVREDGTWKLLSLELVHSLAYPGSVVQP